MVRSSSPAPAAAEDMVLSTKTEKDSDGGKGGSTAVDDQVLRLGGWCSRGRGSRGGGAGPEVGVLDLAVFPLLDSKPLDLLKGERSARTSGGSERPLSAVQCSYGEHGGGRLDDWTDGWE